MGSEPKIKTQAIISSCLAGISAKFNLSNYQWAHISGANTGTAQAYGGGEMGGRGWQGLPPFVEITINKVKDISKKIQDIEHF